MSPTDAVFALHRTEKLEEFGHQSWAEICWYFNDTREQFRMGGQLASIDGQHSDKSMLQVMASCFPAVTSSPERPLLLRFATASSGTHLKGCAAAGASEGLGAAVLQHQEVACTAASRQACRGRARASEGLRDT